MKFSFLFYLLIFYLIISSCNSTKEIKDGQTAYNLKKYDLATSLLLNEVSNSGNQSDKLIKMELLADTYLKQTNYLLAEEWYQKIYTERKFPEDLLEVGKVQMQNEKFEEAKSTFTQYIAESYDHFNGNKYLALCNQVIEFNNSPKNISINNLEKVNTSGYDFAAVPFKENALVVSGNNSSVGGLTDPWIGASTGDLFIVNYDGNKYLKQEPFSEVLNSELWEGSATFTSDYNEIYFTRCGFSNEENGYCKIMHSYIADGIWTEPEILPIFSDSINVGQPFISPNGKRLYFSSDEPNGFGGKDIYFLKKII